MSEKIDDTKLLAVIYHEQMQGPAGMFRKEILSALLELRERREADKMRRIFPDYRAEVET